MDVALDRLYLCESDPQHGCTSSDPPIRSCAAFILVMYLTLHTYRMSIKPITDRRFPNMGMAGKYEEHTVLPISYIKP